VKATRGSREFVTFLGMRRAAPHDGRSRAMMAGNTRDPDGKRILLDIANSFVELAAWAAKVDAGMIVRDC
jgi:hypothetical protein